MPEKEMEILTGGLIRGKTRSWREEMEEGKNRES